MKKSYQLLCGESYYVICYCILSKGMRRKGELLFLTEPAAEMGFTGNNILLNQLCLLIRPRGHLMQIVYQVLLSANVF